MTSWDTYLSAADRETLRRGSWSGRLGFGERPALLLIDVQKYMVGERGKPDGDYPFSCGEVGWKAVDQAARILAAMRAGGHTVVHMRVVLSRDGSDWGNMGRKIGCREGENVYLAGSTGAEFIDQVAPLPGEPIIEKRKASAFFGTPLAACLIDRRIDTVIVVGGSTSNCVRATVVDASQLNYRVIVPREAVFDRIPVSHEIGLFDMDRSFADVVGTDDVLAYLKRLGAAVGTVGKEPARRSRTG